MFPSPPASLHQHEHEHDGITRLALPDTAATATSSTSDSTTSSDNVASKDVDGDSAGAADVEAGLPVRGMSGGGQADDIENTMRARRHKNDRKKVYPAWESPVYPEEDHTNPQYLPPFLLRLFTYILSLPIIKPIATYLSGPSRSTSSQPRLWKFRYIDNYIERPLVRYTRKWTKHPFVLWAFLLAWFLGFTFLARAAWWNASVGSGVTWLDGTSTYWQRNDGCGLGRPI